MPSNDPTTEEPTLAQVAEAIMQSVEKGGIDKDTFEGYLVRYLQDLTKYCRAREQEHQAEMALFKDQIVLSWAGLHQDAPNPSDLADALLFFVPLTDDEKDIHRLSSNFEQI